MRVLLVEDNERLSSLMQGGLARAGFTVDAFASLNEADAAVAAVDYDLILLDLGLPDGDGLDWLKQLRRRRQGIPVLVATARGGLTDRVAGLDTGADDYLVKPFEMDELLAPAGRCCAVRGLASPPSYPLAIWRSTRFRGRLRLPANRSMRHDAKLICWKS